MFFPPPEIFSPVVNNSMDLFVNEGATWCNQKVWMCLRLKSLKLKRLGQISFQKSLCLSLVSAPKIPDSMRVYLLACIFFLNVSCLACEEVSFTEALVNLPDYFFLLFSSLCESSLSSSLAHLFLIDLQGLCSVLMKSLNSWCGCQRCWGLQFSADLIVLITSANDQRLMNVQIWWMAPRRAT